MREVGLKVVIALLLAACAVSVFAGRQILFVEPGCTAETDRFIVREEIGNGANGAPLGVPIPADPKFIAAAAVAKVTVGAEWMVVSVDCPVPVGVMPDRTATKAWKGDCVELFVRPDINGQDYFYYAFNLAKAGESGKYHNGVLVKGYNVPYKPTVVEIVGGFRIVFTIPRKTVFKAMPQTGDEFSMQIVRSGPSAGGVSSWMPAGISFHDPTSFGHVVFGSRENYLARRKDLERKIAEKFAGNKLAVYRLTDPWDNAIAPDLTSRPLERIRMTACRDGRAYCAFALSNLGDIPFLGQIKAFGKGGWMPFDDDRDTGAARHVSAFVAMPVYTRATTFSYDPLVPLPLGSVIRIAPGESSLVWLSFDARGLQPGTRTVTLRVKSATPGIGSVAFPLDLCVRNVELSESRADRACYMYLQRKPENVNMMRFLAERQYNVVYGGTPGTDILPRYDGEGRLVHGNYSQYDRLLQSQLDNGISPERLQLWIYLAWDRCVHPKGSGKVFGEKWCEAMRFYLEGLYAHLGRKFGLTADRIILYPIDEPWMGDSDGSGEFALRAGKFIRSFGPNHRLLVNPLGRRPVAEWKTFVAELAKYYDIIELYRPDLDADKIAFVRSLPFRDVWTYSILQRETCAMSYRLDFWQNLRDGFREVATYWHLDQMGGGDGLDPNDSSRPGRYVDYGTIYPDFDNDSYLLSRRQLGADLGYEDACLVLLCRARAKGRSADEMAVEELVRRGASATSMDVLDDIRMRLLDFAERQ